MKIAVLTKHDLTDTSDRKRLLDALAKSGVFEVVECALGSTLPKDCRRVLVFGGDGTMLEAARMLTLGDIDARLIGVNLGNLGFLTSYERDVSSEELTAALLSEEYVERSLLEVEILGNKFAYALNDVVIKSEGTRPVSLDIFIDGEFADQYRGDGVIVSTAVGSTAYSLSAGGPVLAPNVDANVINPVCPHTLHSRPLVVGGEAKIVIGFNGPGAARLVADGNSQVALVHSGMTVEVKRSAKTVRFVKTDKENFYAKLLGKMNGWSRTENSAADAHRKI